MGKPGAAGAWIGRGSWSMKIGSLKVDTRLLGVGALFVVAAIVGGGISALGVEIPVVGSLRARAALGLVGGLLVAAGVVVPFLASRAEAEQQSRKLAGKVSAKVEWPTAQVRAIDHLGDDESWWVVYLQNDGNEAVYDLAATVTHETGASFSVDWGALQPGAREWYVLRPDSEIPSGGDPPQLTLVFTARGLRWQSSQGMLDLLK